MLASRKKKSKKSPVRRSVKPKSIKSSRSKTVRPAKPKSIKSSRSVKPKKTRPANIARATGTGNGISSIMESTKMISKEIKTISKIFIDNHRILESTKTMISTLSNTMQYIDKHSKQITLLENESQKIQASLMQLNQKADSVKTSGGINENIEKRLADIEKESNFAQVKETMAECLENTKTSAQTLEKISASLNNTDKIESKLDSNSKMLEDVGKLLQSHAQEQGGMDKNIESEISEKISTISREVAGLREQIRGVSETQKTDELTEYVGSMAQKQKFSWVFQQN